jgi:hypothetical protein
MRRWKRQLAIGASLVLALAGTAGAASDPTMTSTSFSVTESEVGGNGQFSSSSSNYNINPYSDDAGSSLGESAVGNSTSNNYQTNSGFNTTGQPGLTMVVNTGSINLGTLSSSVATTATATFDVTDYTSYGFAVQVIGSTPANSGHNLTALTTDTTSAATTEQFGINLVSNSSPVSFGANPLYVPDNVTYPSASSFSYGVAGDGSTGTYGTNRPYTVGGKYRYNSGETIASSPKSSGDTRFTMSFLANISSQTPGGQYTGNISLVATGTF